MASKPKYKYTAEDALDAFYYIVAVLEERPTATSFPWYMYPPLGTPLRRAVKAVLSDLAELGFVTKHRGTLRAKRSGWFIIKPKWKYILTL